MRRTRRSRLSNAAVGVIAALVLLPVLYLAFTKEVPFSHGYQFSAVFQSALNIRPDSPVRIAGVEVGRVTGIESYGDDGAARVSMEIDDEGLPLHTDATLKIRPRLFLEGNFFVDLHPGSPSGKTMPEGYVVPITRTATPVQIDQVLSSLTQPVRVSLQQALAGFGEGLSQEPTPAQNAAQDPLVRGMTGAQALNDTYRRSGPVLKDVSIVNQALLGTEPDKDIPELIDAITHVTAELGQNEVALQGFIRNLDTTLGAFGDRATDLQRSLALLPTALANTQRAFAGLAATAPSLKTFAEGFTVVAEQLPEAYRVTPPFVDATLAAVGPDELGGIAADLAASAADLNAVIAAQREITPIVDDSALCGTRVVLPTLEEKLDDGKLSTGMPNYQELWHAIVGFGGGGQNFDGNGFFAHLFAGAGNTIVTSGGDPYEGNVGGGRAAEPPLGTSPKYPGPREKKNTGSKNPPFMPNVPCKTQARPDLNGPLSKGPADKSRTP
jgi:phospholipid/cholesterol/gamma-HCH transport system substrate-binding protein